MDYYKGTNPDADTFGTGLDGIKNRVAGVPGTGSYPNADFLNHIAGELINVVIRGLGDGSLDAAAYDQIADMLIPRGIFGDGDDGDVTTAGDATLTADLLCDTYRVSAGDVIDTDGFRIFARVGIVLEAGAIIRNNGADAAAAVGGSGAGTSGPLGPGEDGGNGGNGGGGNGDDGADTPLNSYGLGGDGGGGGAATGAGGTAGAVTSPAASFGAWRRAPIIIEGRIEAATTPKLRGGAGGAGGGGGGAAQLGGAGGGGGGVVGLYAPYISCGAGAEIQANGGDGNDGVGTNTGGGGGGGGGAVLCVTFTPTATLSAFVSAGGGTGGTGDGTGGDGDDGDDGSIVVLRP